jgi:thiol reductant ABC exporter CydD subunit
VISPTGWRHSPVDPRLWRQVRAFRHWVAASVAIGLGLTACLVAQATFLASALSLALFHRAEHHAIAVALAGLVVATLVRAALAFASEQAATGAASRTKSELRAAALAKLLTLAPADLAQRHTGELAVTLGHGLDGLDGYVGRYLPRLVLAALAPLVLLGWVAHLDLLSAGILLITLALLPVFMILIGQLTQARALSRWRALGQLSGQFLDAVEGLPILRAFGRARVQREIIAQATGELRRETLGTLRVALLSALVLETLAAVGTALVAVPLGLRLVSGQMTLVAALTILVLAPEVYLPVRRASSDFHASTEGVTALEALWAVIGEPQPSATPSPAARTQPPWFERRRIVGGPIASNHFEADFVPAGVELGNVSVSFPGRDMPVLAGLDLKLAPGESLGITGPSGVGKSTLIAVLAGLIPPQAGTFLADGEDVSAHDLSSWRRRLAWVPQRPTLFSGTVAENLRLGSPEASDADLWAALHVACLKELVAALPGGLESALGEHAEQLSAGERQRLAIARALVHSQAGLLLLDEPTAHLDPATERELVARLRPALRGKSLLLVSHRPGPLELADRVVILDRGQLRPLAMKAEQEPLVAR